MSKSMVEKYEHMLSQDPTSTVFVELARAYLDKGENSKAIEVCRQGCAHHPSSVVGRVLWGKGLINSGKAAEAMQQFDTAVNIDRENPHAYNLISEVLLRKGLYRSALPILRRASALQPHDARIKQWVEQARAALAGGPAPILYDETSINTEALPEPSTTSGATSSNELPNSDPDVFAAFTPPKDDPVGERTVLISEYAPEGPTTLEVPTQLMQIPRVAPSAPRSLEPKPGPPVATGEFPVALGSPGIEEDTRPTIEMPASNLALASSLRPSDDQLPMLEASVDQRTSTAELPQEPNLAAEAPDPFAAIPESPESTETFRGLTSTFQALEQADSAPLQVPPPPPAPSGPNLPSVIPSVELQLPPPAVPTNGQSVLLEEVVSGQDELPTSEFRTLGVNRVSAQNPAVSGGLLDEIPDVFEPPAEAPDAPRTEFSTQATEAIAREYERELREKLQARQQEKTFFQKHALKLVLAAASSVVAIALVGSFLYTRQQHGGENLEQALGRGLAAINADTKEQYLLGVQALEQVLAMDEANIDAWANIGLAKALLYSEHGSGPSDREAALAAMNKPKVRERHPEFALLVDFLTAEGAELQGRRQQLLSSDMSNATVEAQAGRVLLADRKFDEAFKHLQRATELNSRNLRALVSLGEYYLLSEDYESAARILSTAYTLSKYHPQRVIGLAEARLELGRETQEALAELEGLPANTEVPASMKGRYALALGRAQSAAGRHDEATKTLTEGLTANKELIFEFQMAMGAAARNAGRMADAQRAYEEAIRVRPKSEDAKEGLGRVLLARSREKEVLERLRPDGDQRKVSLVRGIAALRLEDTRRARTELERTRVNGKYPAEAAVYLALMDAAEEGGDKAVQELEKVVATTKRHKATAQIALARVYMKRNELTKARVQLEDAAKDPQDYEANALLGQLYLDAVDMGVPQDSALAPLQKAVERNGSHGPSRRLLTRTSLGLGQFPEATKQVEAWTADNVASEEAWVEAAFVFLHTGRFKEAEAAVAKGVKDTADAQAFRIKAQVLFARGSARNAFAALERANKLNKEDAETFCEIGNAFVRQGSVDTALKAYEAARRENAKLLCGLVGPAHAKPSAKGGRPTLKEELLALQKQAFAVWDRALVDASLARVLVEERDLKGALALAESATRTAPFSAPAWFALGEVARKQKNDAKALESYGKAAEYDQSWAAARLSYADALVRSGAEGRAQALPEYEAVLTLSQHEPDLARAKKAVVALKKQLK
jgi:cellulose synthase operon protein C